MNLERPLCKNGTVTLLLSTILSCWLAICPLAAALADVSAKAAPATPAHQSHASMDLSSTGANLSAASIWSFGGGASSVAITSGQAKQIVTPATMLTPAQFVATYQVLTSGIQTISIGGQGNAIGGTLNLSPALSRYVSDLVVPQGVTALKDFGSSPLFKLPGNLTNAGQFYAYSSNPAIQTAIIRANNITNLSNAVLATSLPAATQSLVNNAVPNLGLSLLANNNIANAGIISSAGTLTLSAGGAIVNALPNGAAGSRPTISALGDVNLITNNLVNSGIINSFLANVNLQAITAGVLSVDNRIGAMQAPNGNITINNAGASLQEGIRMMGGDFLSRALNLDAGKGFIDANIGNVSGIVNVKACSADFGAATSNLNLGELSVSGDPTYFNTNGTLTLSSVPATNGNDLALVASQDVIVQSGTLDTTVAIDGTDSNPSTNNGGKITIIAGANVNANPSATGQVNNNSSTTLTITPSNLATKGSATGGAVDLSGVTAINSHGNLTLHGLGGDGGDLTIVAFSGSGAGSTRVPGTINLGTTGSISTYGSGAGDGSKSYWGGNANGNVTVIAGATSDPAGGSAITLPPIFAGSSLTNSEGGVVKGDVTIATATPNISSSLSIKNGTMTGTITAGIIQPTSVALGLVGGDSTIPVGVATPWQKITADYAFPIINASRANPQGPDVAASPLTRSAALDAVATDEANYLASTGHFAHFNLQSGNPSGRGAAAEIPANFNCCGENIGYQAGGFSTPKVVFDAGHAAMMNEPAGAVCNCFNHRTNIMEQSYKYIGISFANYGGSIYFVEDFATGDSSSPSTPPTFSSAVPNVPLVAGIGGRAGLVANSPYPGIHLTIGAVGGSFMTPTSIMAGNGANVNINAGNLVNVPGFIIANGMNGFQGFQGSGLVGHMDGMKGGAISITSGGTMNLYNLQASGGAGGSSVGGNGGAGGTVTLLAQNGDINITPGSSPGAPVPTFGCDPCIAIGVPGGSGGQALSAGFAGGKGGAGGTVSVSAPHGNISLSSIEAGGGGGAGGAGGGGSNPAATSGGAGGAGGSVSVSGRRVSVQYYVNASGGGGGGAGGSSSTGNAGGGGGGGAFAMSGFGGTAGGSGVAGGGGGGGAFAMSGFGGTAGGSGVAGGGGGGGAEIHQFGGPSSPNNDDATDSSVGISGSTGAGGAAGAFGGGGGGGSGVSSSSAGGAGGNMGAAGQSNANSSVAGGAAGAGGAITLQGQVVVVLKKVNDFWSAAFPNSAGPPPLLAPVEGNDSVLALGPNGKVMITTTAGTPTQYSQNADYSTSVKSEVVVLGGPFTVGSVNSNNGTLGAIEAGSQANAININGTLLSSPVTSGTFGSSGSGSVTLTEGSGSNVTHPTFTNGSTATPAELIAIIQVANGLGQTLLLDSNGAATNGAAFTIGQVNLPAGGFLKLVLPSGVTATDSVTTLAYASSARIDGTLQVSGVTGTATISTPILTVNGTITCLNNAAGSSLNLQGIGNGNSLTVNFGSGGMISTTNGNVLFNGNAAGSLSTSSSSQGAIAAGGSGSLVNFNGGSAAVNFSLNTVGGTLTANGLSVQINVASGSLPTGAITSSSTTQISFGGMLTTTGTISGNIVNLLALSGSGAGISLGSDITGTGTNSAATVAADSSGAITRTAGTISATTVTLSSGAGNIGGTAQGAAINLANSGTLKVNTAGNAFVSNTGTLSLGQSTLGAASLYQVTSSGNVTTSGTVTANQVRILAATNSGAGVIIGSSISGTGSGSLITIAADGSGAIAESAGGSLAASTIQLSSESGNVGSASGGGAIAVSGTSTVSVNTTGSAFISGAGGILSLGGSSVGSTAGSQIVVTSSGGIKTTGAVSGNVITLQGASNSGAGITVASSLSGSGAGSLVTLQADASGSLVQNTGGSISGSTIRLASGSGNIGGAGAGSAMITAGPAMLSASTTGSAFISNTGAVSVGASTFGSGNTSQFVLTSSGTITTVGAISGNTIVLQGSTGSGAGVVIGSAIVGSGTNSQVTVSADGVSLIAQAAGGSLSGGTVNLKSGSGNLGSSTAGGSIITNGANILTLNTSGSAFISNLGVVSLGASIVGNSGTTGQQLQVVSTGTITTSGAINANVINLQAAAGSGAGILVASPVSGTGSGGGAVTLVADGSGAISQSGSGNVSAGSLTIATGGGGVGASPASPFNFAAANLSVSAAGTGADAFLSTPSNVNISSASVSGKFFLSSQLSITTGSSAAISSGAAGADSLVLLAGSAGGSGANLNIGAGAALTSGGQLRLENDNLTNGSIIIQQNANLISQGEVDIVVGPVPSVPTNNSAPNSFVSVVPTGSTNVFFGSKSITAVGPNTNFVNVSNFKTVFNIGGSQSASAIILGAGGGGVGINNGAVITSLDFTQQSVVNSLMDLQNLAPSDPRHLGGTLSFTNGQASGNVIFGQSDSFSNVSGAVIPATVKLTFTNFRQSNPINITTTASAPSVVFRGSGQFVSSPASPAVSDALINISSTQPGPAFTIAGAGALTSDLNLTINVAGGIITSGTGGISAGGNLSISTSAGGAMSFGTNVSGGGTATLAAAGSITQTAGLLSALALNLSSSTGSIGAGAAAAINTATGNLVSQAAGTLFVNNVASLLTVGASSAGNSFNITNSGNITVSGNITAPGGISIAALNGASIAFPAALTLSANSTTLSASFASV